uniref:PID domain-containing protein n=1 Tax=Timema monikensis TaxID=170555 RepID=A0A7R9E722_9NEOP|nr:unnamed protein product [Timema monikensis]
MIRGWLEGGEGGIVSLPSWDYGSSTVRPTLTRAPRRHGSMKCTYNPFPSASLYCMADNHFTHYSLESRRQVHATDASIVKVLYCHFLDKNEPSRFLGEGVSFKAKLIGILEVSEARGDRMCQEALSDLKIAIRAAGEHKQRININIAIDGLRLRDEKTGDCLYHHPVHKISFIAQDMSDSRAFGYIFGSPDTGHRFFGIKTDKAASQVVIAMRDLFQVVFELKKKEIEMAKQHIEQHQLKIGAGLFMESGSGSKSEQTFSKMRTIQENAAKENGNVASGKSAQQTSEVIADLLDLEFELNHIQQGIHQMERITPSDPFGPSTIKDDPFVSDPFGDSFAPTAVIPPPPKIQKPKPITVFPPPPLSKETARLSDPFNIPPPSRHPNRRGTSRQMVAEQPQASVVVPSPPKPTTPLQQEKHWFDRETESLFEEGELPPDPSITSTLPSTVEQIVGEEPIQEQQVPSSTQFDVFTELDPLGTGRSKPYIDRKDFFQELKNPPKKVLKDLVTETPSEATAPLFKATFDINPPPATSLKTQDGTVSEPAQFSKEFLNTPVHSTQPAAPTTTEIKPLHFEEDPFAESDPFNTDPFEEDDFSKMTCVPNVAIISHDPFDTDFADFTMFGKGKKNESVSTTGQNLETDRRSPSTSLDSVSSTSPATFHGPLRVSLPPEKAKTELTLPPLPSSSRQTANQPSYSPSGTLNKAKNKTGRLHKQVTMSGIVRIPSPKSSQRSNGRLGRQMTVDVCNVSTSSRGLNHSPTPPSTPTPPRSERRSPSILDNVTLSNRCSITPSPPVVACFPDIEEQDNASRLSGSSAELAEIVPEPPPRPTTTITPIKPPPLPPKRQQACSVFKPPPRPPHADEQPHYDYIENYKTSSSPTSQDADDVKSPPIPVPARRPRFSDFDIGTIPQRPRRHPSDASLQSIADEPDYVPPFPILPPPQKKTLSLNPSKHSTSTITTLASILQASASFTTTSATDDTQTKPQLSTGAPSLDITLSQLTKTGLGELAARLGVSPDHLSRMTLQDFTKYLIKLSNNHQTSEDNCEENKSESEDVKRDKYAKLRESLDEEPTFKAEFETHFENNEANEKHEDVFQETTFDKYAVFRELIEQHSKEEQSLGSKATTSSADEEPQALDEKPLNSIENTSLKPLSTNEETNEDKYAALREISVPEVDEEKENDSSSEKDESMAETSKTEDDYDLLTLSLHQSEGTDSPTTIIREPQSIIESTILEEDVNALEEDNIEIVEDIKQDDDDDEEEEETDIKNSFSDSKIENVSIDAGVLINKESEHTQKNVSLDSIVTEEEYKVPSEGWAKFDMTQFATVSYKPPSEAHSEGGVSPWSSDGKEFTKRPTTWQEESKKEPEKSRRRKPHRESPWREDEESEEGWDDRAEQTWRENGWSDGDSFYGEVTPVKERVYGDERRGRRRRVSPWKGRKSSREPSPWDQEGKHEDEEQWAGMGKRWQRRSMDEEEDDDHETRWKTKPKHRGSSWEEERRRKYGSKDLNGMDYEDGRKRRSSPWKGERDRRGSWESGSWDEEDRYSQREYGDRWSREDEYRRRWEHDMDSRGYSWNKKSGGGSEAEYGRHEYLGRRKQDSHHRYYRDRSRESPWEDEYSEHGEEDSPKYQARRSNWPKRPSSASETRRVVERSSPGDLKPRPLEKQNQSSSKSEMGEKSPGYSYSDWKYREWSGRPRSREGQFNCEQEYDYWPPPKDRPPRRDLVGYEQRSLTLQTRRPHRYRKSQDRSYNPKSPFDDDFSTHSFDFVTDIKLQGGESDTSDSAMKRSPVSMTHSMSPSSITTPTETIPKRKTTPVSELVVLPKEVIPSSPLDHKVSPSLDDTRFRPSRGPNQRHSPFEDDFTPPETRNASARLISSVSSDISDNHKSPFEDVRSGGRVERVVEETTCDSDAEPKNGKNNDDVFLPADSVARASESVSKFTHFETDMFSDSISEVISSKPSVESKRLDKRLSSSLWSSEDSVKVEKHPSAMKMRMTSLFRVDSSSNIKKSESVNIFARENDPFDDDFFGSNMAVTLPRPHSDSQTTDKSNSNNNSDPYNWTKAFDSFNFEEEN